MTQRARRILLVLGIAAAFAPAGCGSEGGGTMTGAVSVNSPVRVAGADVLIDGQSVDGQSIAPGSGTATLFTVDLADPADAPRLRAMYMDYPMHSSMGMMGGQGTVQCYDDGTHCDTMAGDGHYCYIDTDGHIGPQGADCPRGEYVYTFHGTDMTGATTNPVECRVTVR